MQTPIPILCCALFLAACGRDGAPPNPVAASAPDSTAAFVLETPETSTRVLPVGTTPRESAVDTSAAVEFADPGLEAAVRAALEQPSGPLRQNALATLDELVAARRDIADLTGIEHLSNLVFLNLAHNRITDIAPLARLTWLQFLVLDHNRIADLSPLAELDLLEILLLDANQVSDLGPLLPLAAKGVLERIDLAENPLSAAALDTQVAALRAAGVDLFAEEGLLPQDPEQVAEAEAAFSSDIDPADLKILFRSNRLDPDSNRGYELFVMNARGGDVFELFADLEGSFKPFIADWSPDGERLVFSYDGGIHTIRPDGSDLLEVPDAPSGASWPTYSPDGTQLAFFLFGSGSTVLATMPATGGPHQEIINISEELGGDFGYNASLPWSADGEFVGINLFISNFGELFAGDLVGQSLLNLSQTPDISEFGMVFAPVGERVLFASAATGDGEIYLARLDGTPPENLTNHPGDDWSPQWSPDGQRVLFWSNRDDENGDLYVMDLAERNPVNITNHPDQEFGALWSPDGSLITFFTPSGEESDIFVMNADGTDRVNITNSIGTDWTISWSPR